MFGTMGISELIIILVIVLIIFGAGKLPQIGEGVGKALKGFKKEVNEIPPPAEAASSDVTQPEPLPRNHPLLRLQNLVITPHLGSASDRTRRRMIEMSVENLRAGLAGQPLPNRVH